MEADRRARLFQKLSLGLDALKKLHSKLHSFQNEVSHLDDSIEESKESLKKKGSKRKKGAEDSIMEEPLRKRPKLLASAGKDYPDVVLSSDQSNAEESGSQPIIEQVNPESHANPRSLPIINKGPNNDFRSRDLDFTGAKEKGVSEIPGFSIAETIKPITIFDNDTLKHPKLPVSIEEVKGSNSNFAGSNKQGKKLTIEEILGIPRQSGENTDKKTHSLIRMPLTAKANKLTASPKEHKEKPRSPKLQKLYSKLGTRRSFFKDLPYSDTHSNDHFLSQLPPSKA